MEYLRENINNHRLIQTKDPFNSRFFFLKRSLTKASNFEISLIAIQIQ